MTPEQIRDAIAPLISPLQNTVNSIQTDYASLKAEVSALKAAPGNPKAEPKAEGNSISAADFAAAVAAAVVEANKPVLEALSKKVEAPAKAEPTGVRRSFALTGSEFKSKYGFGSDDLNLDTADGCRQAIDAIHASNLKDEKKLQMVGVLGAQKRELQRQEAFGGAR